MQFVQYLRGTSLHILTMQIYMCIGTPIVGAHPLSVCKGGGYRDLCGQPNFTTLNDTATVAALQQMSTTGGEYIIL